MRWSIDTDPSLMLHAKPEIVKKQASNPAGWTYDDDAIWEEKEN